MSNNPYSVNNGPYLLDDGKNPFSVDNGPYLIDDGGTQMIVVDPEGDGTEQALWVRVGDVYYENPREVKTGVWIEYQDNYMRSRLYGPVLLTEEVWGELRDAIEAEFAKREDH